MSKNSKCHSDTRQTGDAASRIAAKFGVSRSTLLRDAKYAENLDEREAEDSLAADLICEAIEVLERGGK